MVLICSSGATCLPTRVRRDSLTPYQSAQIPTLVDISEGLNRSRRITQLQSRQISLRVDGFTLYGNLALDRPRRIRMTGAFSNFFGKDFDLGSNDEIFWLASRHFEQPTMFYARHDEFDMQTTRQILPVSPLWIVEAMGLSELDPYTVTREPIRTPNGSIEIHSVHQTPAGNYERVLYVDSKMYVNSKKQQSGPFFYTREILLYGPPGASGMPGRLVAKATQENHYYVDSIDFVLPKKIQIQMMPDPSPLFPQNNQSINIQIDVGYYSINILEGEDPQRFLFPDDREYQKVNLIDLTRNPYAAITPPPYQQQIEAPPRAAYRDAGMQFR